MKASQGWWLSGIAPLWDRGTSKKGLGSKPSGMQVKVLPALCHWPWQTCGSGLQAKKKHPLMKAPPLTLLLHICIKSQAKRPTQNNTQQNVGRKVGEIPKKEAKVELYRKQVSITFPNLLLWWFATEWWWITSKKIIPLCFLHWGDTFLELF